MSVQITPSPPDLKSCDRQTLAVARYLRRSPILKQRPALMGGQRWDMFRGKRAVRALLDPAYEAARKRNPVLPAVDSKESALQVLAKFPTEKFAFNVTKLEVEDALSKGLKPQSGVPCVLVAPQQRVGEDQYFVWFYSPIPLSSYLYGVGIITAGISLALFQLWPAPLRKLAYYASLLAMAFLGLLLVLTVVRLVLFLVTLAVPGRGIWLFPNLFADVSFFQSFQPLWAWSGEKTLPKKVKPKKRKSAKPAEAAAGAAAPSPGQGVPLTFPGMAPGQATPGGPIARGPDGKPLHPIVQSALAVSMKNTEARLKQTVEREGPKSDEDMVKLKSEIFKEEWGTAQVRLQEVGRQVQAQAQAQAQSQARAQGDSQ